MGILLQTFATKGSLSSLSASLLLSLPSVVC